MAYKLAKIARLSEEECNNIPPFVKGRYLFFNKINHYASCHHETLAGTGYPFKLDSSDLLIGARIITVADIFTALTEERPYRAALEKEAVLKILKQQVKSGALDPKISLSLMDNYDGALEVRNI